MTSPRIVRKLLVAAMPVALVAPVAAVTAPAASASTAYCGIYWGSLQKTGGSLSSASLTDARTGQHTCYDRLVIDERGVPAAGFNAWYTTDSATLRGGATIHFVVKAPAYDVNTGQLTYMSPQDIRTVGYRTLYEVKYAGSFEGYTDFMVGVRARLPFRVFTLSNPSRIVLDVAHQWQQ